MITKTENYNLEELNKIGNAMKESGFFTEVTSSSKALVQILAGKEIGFAPFTSINGIHIVKGKPTISANLMASSIKRSAKYDYKVKTLDNEKAIIAFYEINNNKFELLANVEFSIEDAIKAALFNKKSEHSPWVKYPKNMLFARAISNGIRWYCPDVFNGNAVYTPEELGKNVDEEGNIIEAERCENETQNQICDDEESLKLEILKSDSLEELNNLYKNSDKDIRSKVLKEFKKQKEVMKKISYDIANKANKAEEEKMLITKNKPISAIIQPDEVACKTNNYLDQLP